MKAFQYVASGVAGVLVVVSLAACSGAEDNPQGPLPAGGCPDDPAKPLTLVVGARANSPQPDLPDEVKTLVTEASKASQPVQVVRVDGDPTVALNATFRTNDKNDTRRTNKLNQFVQELLRVVEDLAPKEPEADVLGALTEAGRVTEPGGTVVLLDSGLATVGPLSFTDTDMFGADPDEVAAYLTAQNLLPDLTSKSLLLAGVGISAEPQPKLDENLRNRIVTLWQAVADKADASCVAEQPVPSRRTPFETDIPVAVVELPAPQPFDGPCDTTVLADSGSVGFVANTADLRAPEAAKRTLQQLVEHLAGGQQQVTLIGNTAKAGNSESGRKDLSLRRANAIKDALVELGVDPARITTRGDGSTGPHYANDRAPDGTLIPAAAARNRAVVVDLACPEG